MRFKARKKPVEIWAIQWIGWNASQIKEFCPIAVDRGSYFEIPTMEGTMKLTNGNVLIKGVNGEFYPCDYEIFMKTYDVIKSEDL